MVADFGRFMSRVVFKFLDKKLSKKNLRFTYHHTWREAPARRRTLASQATPQ